MENDVDLRRCDLLARKLPEMEQWVNEKCAGDPAARWENTYICHQVQRRKSGGFVLLTIRTGRLIINETV